MSTLLQPARFGSSVSSVSSRAIALWKATTYDAGNDQLTDLTGHGHHAVLGSSVGADTNDPLRLEYAGTKYLYLPGSASNNLSVPRPFASCDYTITYDDLTTQIRTVAVANPLIFGNTDADFAGLKVREIEVRNTVGGAVGARFIANNATEPYATFVDSLGVTWTFNRSSTGRKACLVDRTLLLFGTDDYCEVADHNDLDFALGDSLTLAVLIRTYNLPSSGVYAGKANWTVGLGYFLYQYSGSARLEFHATAFFDATVTSPALGVLTALTGVRNVVADTGTMYREGTAGTPVADPTTNNNAVNALALQIGHLATGSSPYMDFEFFAGALLREALSAADVLALATELRA